MERQKIESRYNVREVTHQLKKGLKMQKRDYWPFSSSGFSRKEKLRERDLILKKKKEFFIYYYLHERERDRQKLPDHDKLALERSNQGTSVCIYYTYCLLTIIFLFLIFSEF